RSFFLTTAERKPLTECACQPVAFISSSREAPFDRSSRARSISVFEVFFGLDDFAGLCECFGGRFRVVSFSSSLRARGLVVLFETGALTGATRAPPAAA